MEEKECQNIIEQIKDPQNLNDACKRHVNVCKKCATTLSLLLTIKAGPTPTAGLVPSASFITGVIAGIGAKTVVSSTAATAATTTTVATVSTKTIIGTAIGVSLAAALGFGIMFSSDDSVKNFLKNCKGEFAKKSIIELELKELETRNKLKSPVLKFSSPADEVE